MFPSTLITSACRFLNASAKSFAKNASTSCANAAVSTRCVAVEDEDVRDGAGACAVVVHAARAAAAATSPATHRDHVRVRMMGLRDRASVRAGVLQCGP